MLQVASVRTAKRAATNTIGHMPKGDGGPSWRHAQRTWNHQLATLSRQRIQGDQDRVIPLAFTTGIAHHALHCPRCQTTGALDRQTPRQWLYWALGRRPATRAILKTLLATKP